MARIELPATEIVARYRNGESTPELAHAFDVSQPTIWRRLVAAGVKCRRHGWSGQGNPKRGGPLHTDVHGYLRTADRSGKMCCVHRGCWEAYRGPIPIAMWFITLTGTFFTTKSRTWLACLMLNTQGCMGE